METFLKILFFFIFPQLDLWQKCADLFTPTPTFLQCRKYFEQKRTAFGKIETFEMRSGSAARERTAREEEILETWSFLKGHIVHAATTASQRFSSGHKSSSSDMSGLSAHSMQRRRALKKKRVGEATPGTSTSTTPLTHLDLEAERNRVLGSLLEQASQLTGPRQPSTMMTSAEMYAKMMGEQLAMVEKEDLLSVVFPMLNILMNYFNNKRQQPQPTSLPQPTSMQAPPPPVPTPGPRFQMPGAGQQPPMQPGPAFAQPTYGQEQSTVFPVPSTSGYQQQQPPHMPPTPVSAYPPYSQQMPYSSGYQVPAMPFQSGPMQQQPSTSGYPATGMGRYPPQTPPVYTPISGASSGKPASTNTSPSKRPFLDSLDTISLSPYCAQTPSPLTPLTAGMARAFSGGSDSLNTPVITKANEDDKEDGDA